MTQSPVEFDHQAQAEVLDVSVRRRAADGHSPLALSAGQTVSPFDVTEVATFQRRVRPAADIVEHLDEQRAPRQPSATPERHREASRRGAAVLADVREDRHGLVLSASGRRDAEHRVFEADAWRTQPEKRRVVERLQPSADDAGGVADSPRRRHRQLDRVATRRPQAVCAERRAAVQRARPVVERRSPSTLRPRGLAGVGDVDAVVYARPLPPAKQSLDVVVRATGLAHLTACHDAVLSAQQVRHGKLVHAASLAFRVLPRQSPSSPCG